MRSTSLKILTVVLLIVLVLLQYRLWLSREGVRQVEHLERAVRAHQALNARLTRRNERLAAQVADLKTGTAAVEELARSQLGMIGPDETFYQVVEPAPLAPPRASARGAAPGPCAFACGPATGRARHGPGSAPPAIRR